MSALSSIAIGFLIAGSVVAQELPAVFSFSPRTVAAGDGLIARGARFAAGSRLINLLLTDANGQGRSLGIAVLTNGAFETALMIPSTTPPGRYLLSGIDDRQKLAINLTGTITIVGELDNWFDFWPTSAVPGGSFQIWGRILNRNPSAYLCLRGTSGSCLPTAQFSPADSRFLKSVTVPSSLNAGQFYTPFLAEVNSGTLVQNTRGPIVVNTAAVSPAVAVGAYPIGAVVDEPANRIYVPNGADNTVSVVDGVTNRAVASIPVGGLPCAVAINPNTRRIYVTNVNTNNVSVIDAVSNSVIATVPTGPFPCAIGAVPGTNRIYAGNYLADTVTVIDGATNTVADTVSVGRGPFGMAVNPVTSKVYIAIGFSASVTVLDSVTGSIAARIPVGRVPDAVAVDSGKNRVYVANYFDDNLSVIDGAANTVSATIPTGRAPSGIAVQASSGNVYVGEFDTNSVSVLSGSNLTSAKRLTVGLTPDGIVVNQITGKAYSVNSNSNSVSVIDSPVLF